MTNTATAQELRAKAAEKRADAIESYERCGSDGFLSQAASETMASVYEAQADLLEGDGMAEFVGLYNGTERVPAKLINTEYGLCWLLRDDVVAEYKRKFIPFGRKSRVQRDLGLTEKKEMAKTWADVHNSGVGVSYYRIGDDWGVTAKARGE